jgi:hypothetical protein
MPQPDQGIHALYRIFIMGIVDRPFDHSQGQRPMSCFLGLGLGFMRPLVISHLFTSRSLKISYSNGTSRKIFSG